MCSKCIRVYHISLLVSRRMWCWISERQDLIDGGEGSTFSAKGVQMMWSESDQNHIWSWGSICCSGSYFTGQSSNMELCGDYKPKASPSSSSAITQFPSNYIFRLIKCGCLLIEILAMCSIAVSIELEVLLRRGLFVIMTSSDGNRAGQTQLEWSQPTAGSDCVRTY